MIAAQAGAEPEARTSALTAELMYLVLVGEMQFQSKEAGAAYSLILDAARKSGEPDLYRRAINIALQSRSGDAAMGAARTWANSDKGNPEPQRVMLQVMLTQNQIDASANVLEELLDIAKDANRNELIDLVGQTYARVNDKAAAVQVLTRVLRLWQRNSANASSAWTALARTQLAAGMSSEAGHSIERALSAVPVSSAAGLLAVEMLEGPSALDEKVFIQHLAHQQNPELVRMAYSRYLLGASRWSDARQELAWLTQYRPDTPEPWLLLGALQLQDKALAPASESFQRFLALSGSLEDARRAKATTQAYLSLAQVAELQQQFAEARAWLDKIDTGDGNLGVQIRYATLLAREGKVAEAVALIEATPSTEPSDQKAKWLAQAQLLRDAGRAAEALQTTESALQALPNDTDLLFEQSLLFEKLSRFDDMERVLRKVMEVTPDNAHAYNALGYSLADRNTRLPEAQALIKKAIQLAPEDAYIMDSLGWIEFRLGLHAQAANTLRRAWGLRADAEIAAHLAEVLWTLGQMEEAKSMLNEARQLQPDNETFKRTLERLKLQ